MTSDPERPEASEDRRRSFRANLTLQAVYDVSQFVVMVLVHALLARKLGVAGLGALAWAETVALIATNFADLGVERATVVMASRLRLGETAPLEAVRAAGAVRVVSSALLLFLVLAYEPLSGAAGALFGPVFELFLPRAEAALEGPRLLGVAFLLALAMLWQRHVQSLLQALELRRQLIVARMSGLFALVGGLVVLALLEALTPLSVLSLLLVRALAGTLVAQGFVRRLPYRFYGAPTRAGLRRLFGTSGWTLTAVMAATLSERLDVLLLGRLAPAEQVGIYAGAQRGYSLLTGAMSSFYQVLFPRIAGTRDPAEIRQLLRRIFSRSLWVLLGLVPLSVLAPFWIPLYLGPDFELSALVFQILFLRFCSTLFVAHFGHVFYRFERAYLVAGTNLLQLGVSVSANWWLIPRYGALGAAAANLLTALPALLVYIPGLRWTLASAAAPPPRAAR